MTPRKRGFGRWSVLFGCLVVIALALGSAAFAQRVPSPNTSPRPQVIAQFGVGNILGAGKDFAVKQALSAFGKSIGDQLPIVVDASDAFPTVPSLPGAPFSPTAAPDIAAQLRGSRDGTIALPPGDYTFPVGVFCMRAKSASPTAHRYLVAPLHGSAADVITALNSRIPSYPIDHHVLQVLSWDIQAGMAYGAMQTDQRAAVDRIIPEYRGRLDGDVYERIRDGYTATTRSVPGMPSFEDALGRVGPIGAQVVALQNLRQELAQPPPTFEELARSLVPMLPAGGAPNPTGETPWSRYSDRVFVRFVTAGNYATPGTYDVRVLPASGAAQSRVDETRLGDRLFARFVSAAYSTEPRISQAFGFASDIAVATAASVPFTNIVNNPGTDAVQPLTQAPQGGASSPLRPVPPTRPTRRPRLSAPPTITSETVATRPFNRDRKTVGVGEEVTLTFSDGEASWNFSGRYDSAIIRMSDGSIEPVSESSTTTYTAASVPAIETITARGKHGTAEITFYVVAPSGIVNRRLLSTPVYHTKDRPDSGLQVESYVTPDSVSFQNINVVEREAGAIATGFFTPFNGLGHGPNPVALPAGPVVPGLGSKINWIDTCYSGDPGTRAPFVPGSLVFQIPYEYQLRSGGDFHPFAIVTQASALQSDDKTLETTKARAGVSIGVADATTSRPPQPAPQGRVHR